VTEETKNEETTEEELNDRIAELRPRYQFRNDPPPFRHQKICFLLGAHFGGQFPFFIDMSLGKSRIALDLINWQAQAHSNYKALIVVPYLVHLGSWKEQIETHAPNLSYTILEGSSKDRVKLLGESESQVFVLNYAGLTALCRSHWPFHLRGPCAILTSHNTMARYTTNAINAVTKSHHTGPLPLHFDRSHKPRSHQIERPPPWKPNLHSLVFHRNMDGGTFDHALSTTARRCTH
jgi:hypothetical protein